MAIFLQRQWLISLISSYSPTLGISQRAEIVSPNENRIEFSRKPSALQGRATESAYERKDENKSQNPDKKNAKPPLATTSTTTTMNSENESSTMASSLYLTMISGLSTGIGKRLGRHLEIRCRGGEEKKKRTNNRIICLKKKKKNRVCEKRRPRCFVFPKYTGIHSWIHARNC